MFLIILFILKMWIINGKMVIKFFLNIFRKIFFTYQLFYAYLFTGFEFKTSPVFPLVLVIMNYSP